MPIIVVGGDGRGVGKTALVCGLIRALPENRWTAVKISGHAHGKAEPVWEETEAGQGSGTARYLAAGARRALLVTAGDEALGHVVRQVIQEQRAGAYLIFESNRVVRHLQPDLCLAVARGPELAGKRSFAAVLERMDAQVELADRDAVVPGATPHFQLESLARISPAMLAWVRERL